MSNSRRQFLSNALVSSAAVAAIPAFTFTGALGPQPRIKLSISSYSYWHFKGEKFPIERK